MGNRMPFYDRVRLQRTLLTICLSLLVVLLLASFGCAKAGDQSSTDSNEETATVTYGMAGKPVDVVVSRQAIESTPTAPVLDSPEQAIRSYLAWVSFAYRTARPDVAAATMTEAEQVRVDAYCQYNIQTKGRLIDQQLKTISFDEVSGDSMRMTVSATEEWSYTYVSISEPEKRPGKVIAGPHTARYESLYTLVKREAGWVVDSVKPTPLGEVE
jgi:hypothetical protein